MEQNSFILRGDLCWSTAPDRVETLREGWLVCVEGVSAGVYAQVPEAYRGLPVVDCRGKLVTPGLVDLHVHAPQYAFRGLGMDLELLGWLDTRVFPEEAGYRDLDYARRAYRLFARDLKQGPNTRAVVFATVHTPATALLMDLLEETGVAALVGKVNMDRNCPDDLREESAAASAGATVDWLEAAAGRYRRVRPILTPRFIPSCTDALMARLGELRGEYDLPVQSHLSENQGEVEWVRQLCPWAETYGAAYDRFGLLDGGHTVMAHCVLTEGAELALLKRRGVWVAHCPASNANLSSGVAPVRRFLREGLRVGLGSDVAGGHAMSIFRAMADAIQCSKLRWRLQDRSLPPLTAAEAFYLGTLGGGSFFGRVGSFQPGYELDAVVLDDSRLAGPRELGLEERLERAIYLSEDRDITAKYVRGRKIL